MGFFAQGSDGSGNLDTANPDAVRTDPWYQGLPTDSGNYNAQHPYAPSDPRNSYGGFDYGAKTYSDTYGQAAANSYNRKAPQANYDASGANAAYGNFQGDQAGQNSLAASLQQIASGQGNTAADRGMMLNQRQAMDAQTAMGNSARGGAVGEAGAARMAQQAQTGMGIQGQQQLGALRYNEQANAQQQLSQLYTQQQQQLAASRGQGQQQTQFAGQQDFSQEQMNQQRELAYRNAQANVNAQQLSANMNSVGAQQQANAALGLQQQGFNNQLLQSGIGAGFGAASGLANGWAQSSTNAQTQDNQNTSNQNAMSYLNSGPGNSPTDPWSDGRMKTAIRDEGEGTLADQFLRWASPKSYAYSDPSKAPNQASPHGRYLGVIAQDLERVPEIGHQLVESTPAGKRINSPAAISALLAGVGRLDERMRSLESKKGKR